MPPATAMRWGGGGWMVVLTASSTGHAKLLAVRPPVAYDVPRVRQSQRRTAFWRPLHRAVLTFGYVAEGPPWVGVAPAARKSGIPLRVKCCVQLKKPPLVLDAAALSSLSSCRHRSGTRQSRKPHT